jgi:uncharacterized protein YcbX
VGSGQLTLGVVAELWRYPVKSMLGERVGETAVTARGLTGDRAYALLDVESGRVVSAKNPAKWARMFELRAVSDGGGEVRIGFPDGSEAALAGAEARLSSFLGREVRLITEPPAKPRYETLPLGQTEGEAHDSPLINGFFDLGAVHLLSTGTLEHLRSLYAAGRFERARFRPNILLRTADGGPGGFLEDGWIGKTLLMGSARLKVFSPTIRCVMTTLPQGDLPNDPGVLKTAALHNHANVGCYAVVVAGGVVREGDEARVVDSG